MKREQQLVVFKANTENVRRLNSAVRQVRRAINDALRRNDDAAFQAQTLVFALLYCARFEALFQKIVHTPFGLELSEIAHIGATKEHRGIAEAWKACVSIGLAKLPANQVDIGLIKSSLEGLIKTYVQDPAELRNKIAHGQWAVALNKKRTSVNQEMSDKIANLDVIEVDRWLLVSERLSSLVEHLIESPSKAFPGTFAAELTKVAQQVKEMDSWTMSTRSKALKKKPKVQQVEPGA